MNILGIDTATEACSVAVCNGSEVVERFEVCAKGHIRLLMPMLQSVLSEARLTMSGVDAIAFGRGPGSFTGVRIATAFAQGLAMGLDKPAIGVSSLHALAQRCIGRSGGSRVAVALDARMGQVYWGTFERDAAGCTRATAPEALLNPGEVPHMEGKWLTAGIGWQVYRSALADATGLQAGEHLELWPHAADIAWLAAHDRKEGVATTGEDASPLYLRHDIARKKA